MVLPKQSITLIHVVHLCIWPGQIPSGDAICPTCSKNYLGNLVNLNIPADVRAMKNFCLKICKMWTTHSWQTAEWPHMTRNITCAMLCSFGDVSWENWNFLLWKFPAYVLLEWLECFYLFYTRLFAFWLFLISPLWLGCILHHRQTCSLQMISSGFPICSALTVTGSSSALAGPSKPNCPLHRLKVWHLHSMLLSVYRRKSGLMSVSGSLTKQSAARNIRVILVETVICSICQVGGETKGGHDSTLDTHTSRVIRW